MRPEWPGRHYEPVATWKQYQEDVASFFRSLGYEASTNVTVEGARGRHDVDVLVSFRAAGQTVTWAIECKQWERPVPKERVLIGCVSLTGVIFPSVSVMR